MLKERIVSEWPKGELRGLYYKCSLSLVNTFLTSDKKIVPKAASDIKLINAGKILENGKTVARCETPFDDDLPKSVITMHVIVQPSPTKPRPEKKLKRKKPHREAFAHVP
ncbi:hypothetical protein Bca4012_052342 [Brassica carinata]